MADVDYRALRKRVREERRARRTIKHPICLDAALYDEWAELKEQERRETIDRIGDDDGPDPTLRAGELPTSAKLELLEARIREASVVAVFNIPDPDTQSKRNAAWRNVMEEDADKQEAYGKQSATETIETAFDHFIDADGHPIPAEQFGLEDLRDLIGDWSHGQLFGLATDITTKSREVPELPLSVRSSLLHPHSDATSS